VGGCTQIGSAPGPRVLDLLPGDNLGAFVAPLVCGTLGELYGWHYGFAAAGVGMLLSIAIYLSGSQYLPLTADPVRKRPRRDFSLERGAPSLHCLRFCSSRRCIGLRRHKSGTSMLCGSATTSTAASSAVPSP